jgi:hypothetical protein
MEMVLDIKISINGFEQNGAITYPEVKTITVCQRFWMQIDCSKF